MTSFCINQSIAVTKIMLNIEVNSQRVDMYQLQIASKSNVT